MIGLLAFVADPTTPHEAAVERAFEIIGLIAFPLLVATNGLFVAAEFALVAVRKTRMEDLLAKGIRGAGAVLAALGRLDRCIAATQLGITLASLGLGFVVERGLASVLAFLFGHLPHPFDWLALHSVSATIAFVLITFLHVVLGELVPKTVALQAPDRVALWLTPPLLLFEMAMRPFIATMTGTARLLFRALRLQPMPEGMVHSVEELALLIEDTEEAGIIDADQAALLHNVFLFANKKVKDCMVPRDKMDALDLMTPLPTVLEKVRSSGHTRMPVYEGTLDNIVGIVNTKDLFFLVGVDNVVVLEDALYPAIFLKPDEEAANALRLFKRSKKHLALVRDEDDKILGVVTLEDVLEEIIGELEDEQDLPIPPRSLRKLRRYRPRRRK
ncbi:MAG TPA: hemolysin family protein [Gemmataceae bacterium]|nr:hemolysin family protein [Gemmataceae bacterium]